MFRIELNEYWQNYLSNLPETGMGYQKVIVNGEIEGIVLNSKTLTTNVEINQINQIKL